MTNENKIIQGDALEVLKTLESESIDCVITSPPYWNLRDYGVEGQLGLEKTPEEYVAKVVEVFKEVMQVLKNDGTLWLSLGDTYSTISGGMEQLKKQGKETPQYGSIPYASGYDGVGQEGKKLLREKNLVGIPWRVAFALQANGWYLRQDIIWAKPNPMPESVTDRCTKSHEYIFLMSKGTKYYFNSEAIKEKLTESSIIRTKTSFIVNTVISKRKNFDKYVPTINPNTAEKTRQKMIERGTRNKRSVWTVTAKPFKEAHFATFPEALIAPMVMAGCPKEGIVLDPFMGAGTTAVVAKKLGRRYLGIELNPVYIKIAEDRLKQETLF